MSGSPPSTVRISETAADPWVSAALALTPLITFAGVALAANWWPSHVFPEEINLLAYGVALLVVLGSAVAALGHRRSAKG